MNRTIRSVFFRVLCAGLALLLLAGCADGGSTASSSKAAVSGGEGSASVDSETGEPVLSGDASEAASGDASAAATSSAAPVQTGVVADIPQKAADPVAVEETKAGKLSSFNVSKTGILQAYPEYDERIERDYTYTVTVTQGSNVRSLTCYNHCDAVASSDRTLNGDTVRRFCEFAFSGGPVRVDIAVKQDFKSYTVMPSAKGFKSERHDNVISVYLEKPDYFLLKLDNKDDSILSVFADEPEVDVPKKGDPNVIYIEGWYDPGNWYLDVIKDGTTVYLAPGSVLNARLCVRGDNVTVKGRGMILDSFSNIYKQDVSIDRKVNGTVLRVFAVRGSNCTIDGIKMIDARDFNLIVGGSNTKVTNFKVLSSEMCTDGITQAGGSNNSYEHCFIYNGDNGIVVSTGNNQKYKDI
ncbi:MAG: hypothetical protein J6X61_02345, partial [Clostridia bacterium]|nr:hypothetical protein [Clostridia bacterium]